LFCGARRVRPWSRHGTYACTYTGTECITGKQPIRWCATGERCRYARNRFESGYAPWNGFRSFRRSSVRNPQRKRRRHNQFQHTDNVRSRYLWDHTQRPVTPDRAKPNDRWRLRAPLTASRVYNKGVFAALPGAEIIESGLKDLAAGKESVHALVVSVGAHRLRSLGIDVSRPIPQPELRLYSLLAKSYGDAAHSRYNALIRRLVSYERALECER
jgi:hypothetical protein